MQMKTGGSLTEYSKWKIAGESKSLALETKFDLYLDS